MYNSYIVPKTDVGDKSRRRISGPGTGIQVDIQVPLVLSTGTKGT